MDLVQQPLVVSAIILILALIVLTLGALRFRYFSLRTKLIVSLVGVAVIATLAITFVATQTIQSSLAQNAANDLRTRAQAAAHSIGITVDRNVDRLVTMSLDKRVQDELALITDSYPANQDERLELLNQNAERWAIGDPSESLVRNALNGLLATSLRQFGDVFLGNKELFMTDRYGAIVAATEWLPQYNWAQQHWWQVAYDGGRGGVYIGQPEFEPMLDEYGIRIAVPVYAPGRQRVVGIIHAVYTLAALERSLLSNRFGESGKMDLLFPQGEILTADGTFRTLQPAEFEEIKAGYNQPLAMLNYRGTPLLSSQGVVGVSDEQPEPYLRSSAWRTIATIEPDEALAAANAATRAALLSGLGTVVLAVIGALLLAQLLANPIRRLTSAAEQIQAGDLSARANVETGDEIGVLAKTFNSMTARLQDTLAGLERRVAERTQELSQANLTLQSNSAYLSALSDTSAGLFQRLDPQDLLQAIVERAGALVGTADGFVFLQDPGEQEIELKVGVGVYDDLVGTRAQRGVGLAGTVWQTGKPMIIEDYQKWEGRLPGSRRDALHAIVAVPLNRAGKVGEGSEGETIGVIGLAHTDDKRRFGKAEVEILQRFAQLASIALDNARLYAGSEQQVQELAALNQISSILTSESPLEERLRAVGRQLHSIFDVASVYIALYQASDNQVRMPFFMGDHQEYQIAPYPLGPGFTSHVIQTRQPLLINQDMEARARELGALNAGEGEVNQSYLGVPLIVGDEVLGAIGLSDLPANKFRESDLRLLTTIAAATATAIQNDRLLQETRAALAETRHLAERERQAAEQVMALNRRLTREGWREYLAQLNSQMVIEATDDENGNGAAPVPADGTPNGSQPAPTNGHTPIKVPIALRGQVIGEIELEPDESAQVSEEDLGLAAQVAENLGLALDNARLFSETQRRVTELDALNRISQAVTTELQLDALVNVIGDQLRTIFDVENVYIALYDRSAQMISLPYFVNDNVRVTVEPIPFGEGVTSHIIRTRAPLLVNAGGPDRLADLGAKVYGNHAQSYLGVPIFVGDEVTGVISIQSTHREGVFDESSLRLLETIAATVGTAIQNAQLYGAMQEEVVVRQRAEEEIKLSLREKEVLLKEIHHRVKNNLQIISSLLNLQSSQIKDPETFQMFRESQSRVRSMALIHEKLYQSKDLARIDFDGYVRDLIVYLFRSYGANPDQIQVEISTNDMFLGIDTAIPCGLIISELVTNSLKYAFPGNKRGTLHVSLGPEDDGHLSLRVSDTGVGFKPGFDWKETDSLGLQLVNTLTTQLHGAVDVQSGSGGTSFTITFPG